MVATVRQSRRKRARDVGSRVQGRIGEAENGSPVVVLSSNFSIGPLLARGALLPDAYEGDTFSGLAGTDRLRWARGALPAAWVAALVESARNVIPIAIRLRLGRGVRRLAIPGYPDKIDGVCASDVAGMFFRTEKERRRFESVEFSNYDVAGVSMRFGVDALLFESTVDERRDRVEDLVQAVGAPDYGVGGDVARAAAARADDVSRAVRAADSVTGLLAFLLTASPGRRIWMQGVQRLFAKKVKGPATSWPERLTSGMLGNPIDASTIERALLTGIVDVMARYPVEDGWPAEEVLAEVTAEATGRIGPEDEGAVEDLERWASRAGDVLASRAQPQSLADDGFILQRASLLLLLRGDLESLARGETEGIGPRYPGALVRGTASALAALRTGLRAMPARYKRAADSGAPGHWLAYLGEVFVALLQTAKRPRLLPPECPVPTVTYRSIRPLQGEWIVSIASREVSRTPVAVDHGLERLLAMGQHLGFEFQEHGDNGLVTTVSFGDAAKRPVYLELIRIGHGGGPMVRFSAPALKVVSVGSRRRRITRDVAFDLLKRNADPGMNCRFAVNENVTEVLVLVDQLLATLDEAEFLQHVKQVARAAEDFELTQNVGTVSAI